MSTAPKCSAQIARYEGGVVAARFCDRDATMTNRAWDNSPTTAATSTETA